MLKLLFFALVVYVLWRVMFGRPRTGYSGPGMRIPPGGGAAEDMVRCAQCGVHLPRSESLTRGGDFFCSAEHMRLGR